MNREDIICMAKQTGFERLGHDEHDYVCYPDDIVAFATLVASAERERIKQANASEIERINAHIKEALAQPERDYERGFIDGMSKQAQSSVDKAVNAMSQRTWVGLTEEDLKLLSAEWRIVYGAWTDDFALDIEAKLKEKNT